MAELAYVDFEGAMTGRVSLSNGSTTIVTGQFTTGFEYPDINEYEFTFVDSDGNLHVDLNRDIRDQATVTVPGTSPFEVRLGADILTVDSFVGLTFTVSRQGEVLGQGLITEV